ncbi:MAG: DUF262 domain-containing protein [Bacteroidaceae bacterium]
METTTIQKLLAGNTFFVPADLRAYTWEVPSKTGNRSVNTRVDIFLSDFNQFIETKSDKPYFFGNFTFKFKEVNVYDVTDGQQRMTTIVISLSAAFERLKKLRELTDEEIKMSEDMIKRKQGYPLSTVDYDDPLFKSYVINHSNQVEATTTSGKRIVEAYDYFADAFADKDEAYLLKLIKTVAQATCLHDISL